MGSNMDAVHATLDRFFFQYGGARELAAAGILVFPSVVKAGFGFGGEYGEGALLIQGRPVAYYNTVSASFGFQLGAQVRSVIIMFMTPGALDQFQRTAGWKVGIDGSVAIITLGVGGSIDTNKITSPVIGFILDPEGPDVQFDPGGIKDHAHIAVMVGRGLCPSDLLPSQTLIVGPPRDGYVPVKCELAVFKPEA